jgi:hypothetical protein
MPDKPAKYGFLFKALGDAVYAYIYRTNIYAGKPVQEPTEYYIQGKRPWHTVDAVSFNCADQKSSVFLPGSELSPSRIQGSKRVQKAPDLRSWSAPLQNPGVYGSGYVMLLYVPLVIRRCGPWNSCTQFSGSGICFPFNPWIRDG